MTDFEPGDLSKEIDEVELSLKNLDRIKEETPIKMLSPEAHEDAQKIAKQVWIEATRLLSGSKKTAIKDQQGHHLLTITRAADQEEVDLTITKDKIERDRQKNLDYYQGISFDFSPRLVVKTTTNITYKTIPKTLDPNISPFEYLKPEAPRGLAIEKEEAGADELSELFKTMSENTISPIED